MAEQELNKLNVKSDSLPDNWLVTLVNPATGAVAENMTVARFIELFTSKQPEANIDTKGLMSTKGFKWINGINYNVGPHSEFDTGSNYPGLLLFSCYTMTGTSSLGFIAANSNYISPIFQASLKLNVDETAAAYLFKKEQYGNVFIKNNTDFNYTFNIKILA